jgi:hypothetical protein
MLNPASLVSKAEIQGLFEVMQTLHGNEGALEFINSYRQKHQLTYGAELFTAEIFKAFGYKPTEE